MKRSTQVAAPLLAAAALAITTGCQKPQMQRCVDENNKVVDDSFCANQPQQPNQQQQPRAGGGILPFIRLYHYYYGGWGGYGLGSVVGGGSNTPDPSTTYATRSGVTTRGGFGSSFHSGEGEGGGHGSGAGE
ncbi:hypothetical protein EDE15_2179 [Edaphobacter aggregans]|uniref:Lipoprotein n=1 Tax=Edaphobacter aggregans TaxID=570835 RepID=A0A428MIC5_9BACT|nr:hypothetical protein [Edaphobacter aggregans]RSL16658.1 hypothetical protein EDE15_2179 [Edaphobacter aggregans]